MATISKSNSDEISFIAFIIPEFAAAYKMNITLQFKNFFAVIR
jgi:hypothetical protein